MFSPVQCNIHKMYVLYCIFVTIDSHYIKFLSLRGTAGSPCLADFPRPWKWPESVFLVLTKRKADSGDEIVWDFDFYASVLRSPAC